MLGCSREVQPLTRTLSRGEKPYACYHSISEEQGIKLTDSVPDVRGHNLSVLCTGVSENVLDQIIAVLIAGN